MKATPSPHWLALAFLSTPLLLSADEPIDIGDRRELFVDDLLLGEMKGTQRKLHSPQKLPRSAFPPRPFGHYATVFKDGDR